MPEAQQIFGHLDEVSPFEIRGWASKLGEDQPQRVSIFLNGELKHEIEASLHRSGTVGRGCHRTGYCGFGLKDPFGKAGIKKGDQVQVKLGDFELKGSPWNYDFERPKVFYMHIAKAGGTSVNEFFESHLGASNCFVHIEGKKWDPLEIVENYKFISGHVRIQRIRQMIDLKGFYMFTVLRDPESHIMSHLAWVKGIAKDPSSRFFKSHTPEVQELALRLKQLDFEDITALTKFFETLSPQGYNLFDNCQSRYFLKESPSIKIDLEYWDKVEEGLQLFNTVGNTSDLSGFSKSIAKELHFRPNLTFPISNVQKGDKPQMDEEFRNLVEPFVALDKKLIAHHLT